MSAWHVFPIALGLVAIVLSLRPGTFYSGGMGLTYRKRPIPTWLGRALFILIGSSLVTSALTHNRTLTRVLSASIPIAIGVAGLCIGLWPRRNNDYGWRDRIAVLLFGAVFLCIGLIESLK
jgi:hypothetical protein